MRGISRRAVLGTALAAAAAGVTGCQLDTGGATPGAGGSAGATKITFPDYPTKITPAQGTIRWIDSGDLKSVFEKAVLEAFTAKHEDYSYDYQGTSWETIRQVVSLGIRNGTAPDVFQLSQDIPSQVAISEGWVQPIEDVIPDFENWRRQWPEEALIPGIHEFDGKLYGFPLNSSRRLDKMVFYDTENLKAAGYDDPVAEITTWDDIHTALTKITKTGKSGLMTGRDGLGGIVHALAVSLGWRAAFNGWAGMDMKTGQYVYDAPEIVEGFEFLQRLNKDKLLVPGFLSLLEKDARSQLTSGDSGMMFAGPYSLPAWKAQAPQWQTAVGKLPAQDGSDYVVPFAETGANNVWLYAKSKLTAAVGQLLAYMGSPEGQKQMVILSEGNLESLQPGANTAAGRDGVLDERAKTCSKLAREIMRACPQVEMRNPDVALVRMELKPVTPLWQDLIQGLFTGDLSNPKAQFAKYNQALEKALDTAIAAAKKKGSSVTRDDFAFANWDPQREYTAADYRAL